MCHRLLLRKLLLVRGTVLYASQLAPSHALGRPTAGPVPVLDLPSVEVACKIIFPSDELTDDDGNLLSPAAAAVETARRVANVNAFFADAQRMNALIHADPCKTQVTTPLLKALDVLKVWLCLHPLPAVRTRLLMSFVVMCRWASTGTKWVLPIRP